MLYRLSLLCLVTLLSVEVAVAQQAGQIEQMLRERDRQIKAIVGERGQPSAADRERLRAVVNDAIDFRAMSRVALGPFWSDLSSAQQRAFVDRFGEVVRAQSLSDLELYRARVTYDGIDVSGETAVARTRAAHEGRQIRVDYALHRVDGDWRVTDITIDGTSTADGYARSFQRVMRRDGVETGFERLMTSLQRRLERG